MSEPNITSNNEHYQETRGNETQKKRVGFMEQLTKNYQNADQPNQEQPKSKVSVFEDMVNKSAMHGKVEACKPASGLNRSSSSSSVILDKIVKMKPLRMDEVNSRKPDLGRAVKQDKWASNASENWKKLLLLEQRLKESRNDNKNLEKSILFQKDRIRRYKKKLDLAFEEKNMAKEEMIQFKKDTYEALEVKNTETTDRIKYLNTEIERLRNENQNMKIQQLNDLQTRNRMLAESAELKHRVAGLEAELESKDDIIFNLKLAQSQEAESNRIETDGLLDTISAQESEVNSLKSELTKANQKLKDNVNKTHNKILEHKDMYEDLMNKLLTSCEDIKDDNQKKDNIISGQKVENAKLNIELREVKENLKRVEDLLSAEQVTDSHSVDIETIRKKSLADTPSKSSGRGSGSAVTLSQVSLESRTDTGNAQRVPEQGEVLVTLLPVNEKLPWITPAKFRPELVPEELMTPVLTLTVEEYVSSLDKLTKDMRFLLYNLFYKRILVVWIVTAFIILLGILFGTKKQGLTMFGLGVAWLIMNAAAIFLCMWVKLKLNKSLEGCIASVNAGLIKHKLLLGVDDRGKLSCHKVNLCFLYFDSSPCLTYLEKLLDDKPEDKATNGVVMDREAYLRDIEGFQDREIVVSGRNSVKIGGKHERAEKLYLHYSQRWAKEYLRRRLDWMVEDLYGRQDYSSNTNPRHLRSALCPCQYIEEHLKNKRERESMNPCTWSGNPCQWCD